MKLSLPSPERRALRRCLRTNIRVGVVVTTAVLSLPFLSFLPGAPVTPNIEDMELIGRKVRITTTTTVQSSTTTTSTPTSTTTATRYTGLEPGTAGFDQVQAWAGSYGNSTAYPYTGSYGFVARIDGTDGGAYSRGLFTGVWSPGQTIAYRAAFYLPPGFMSRVQAETQLMRLDNYPDDPTTTDRTGAVIYGGDKKLYLVRQKGNEQVALLGPYAIADGWNVIEVRQRLASVNGVGSNQMYLNGVLLGTSTAANNHGNTLKRIRYGIVAVGGSQTYAQTLYVDDASITTLG